MNRFLVCLFCCLFSANLWATDPLPVADVQRTDPVDFGKEIAPILKRNCVACHHEKESEGGLALESLAALLRGGDSGPVLFAKKADESLLLLRARGVEDELMPPPENEVGAKPLTPEELGLLKLWIDQGAQGEDVAPMESIQWQPIPETIRTIYALDVSPDGRYAAVGRGNRIAIVDMADQSIGGHLVDPGLSGGNVADVDLIQSVAFSPDGERIASGGFRTLKIWRKRFRELELADSPLRHAAGFVAVNQDESRMALVNAIGEIEVWKGTQRLQLLKGHSARITGLQFAGDWIYSSDRDGRLVCWNGDDGALVAELEVQTPILKLAVSPAGGKLAAIDVNRQVLLFDLDANAKTLSQKAMVPGIVDANHVLVTDQPVPMVVIASESGGVKMINFGDQKVVRKLDHGAVVNAMVLTNDQQRLTTGGRDGVVKVWNVADGKLLTTCQGDPKVQLLLASASRDAARQKATVGNLNKQTEELEKLFKKEQEVLAKAAEEKKKADDALAAELKKHADAVAAVSKTQALIVKADTDSKTAQQLIATATKAQADAKANAAKMDAEIQLQTKELQAVEQTAKETQAKLAAVQKQLDEANAKAVALKKMIQEKQAAAKKAAQNASEAKAAIDKATRQLAEAKAVSEKSAKTLENEKKAVTAAEESKLKSEKEVAKRKQIFDTATNAKGRAEQAIPQHQVLIASQTMHQKLLGQHLAQVESMNRVGSIVDVTIQKDVIAALCQDGSVRTYQLSNGQPLTKFESVGHQPSTGLVFQNATLCGFHQIGQAEVWATEFDWQLERTIGSIQDANVISDRVTAIDFRPDGLTVAVGSGAPSRAGEVKVFAVDSGTLLRDFGDAHSDTVLGLDFSPDGKTIASSAADKTIRILDVVSGEVVRSLEGHTHHVLSLAWQDDGQTIASASADKSIKIWNAETGEQRRTISGFAKEITAVSFVQTSNRIVTACADGNLRLSDSANGKAVRNMNAAGDFLFTLRVTPDGTKLLAGGQSGVLRIWTLADGKMVHELK